MSEITVDVWLYGELANYGGEAASPGYANLQISLPAGAVVRDLLAVLKMNTDARGITFINGNLSAMPGLQPDLDHKLNDKDRIAFFHLRAMWPFQYRHGAAMIDEMQQAMAKEKDQGLHHAYNGEEPEK
jgi:hypothetical protein